jgi:eukaryotic-like serine/threonine-protein kinase
MSAMHESTPEAAPQSTLPWVGRVLPSGLRVLAGLGETADGTLYSAAYPTGLQVVLLILRYRRDRVEDAVVLASIRNRVLQAIELKHPNVAGVYATGETADGSVYIVLEPLVGEPMSEMLAARQRVPVPEAMDLCLQACAGLQAAHALGIVHGKLSPSSVLLVRGSGGQLGVKLVGFKMTPTPEEEDLKQQSGVHGYAKYAGPERLEGQAADQRSDVYSVAALLHHLIAGAPPANGSVARTIPRSLRPVLGKALAKDPSRRFQSIAEFAAGLDGASEALRQPASARAGWPVALAGAAVTLIAAAGLGLLLNSRGRATQSRTEAAVQETGRTVVVDREPAPPARPGGPAARPPRAPDRPRSPKPSTARPQRELRAPITDSASRPKISPFRQSHPWAAVPGGRYYYRSSCPAALSMRDLIFFSTEDEARARGFVLTPMSECR